MVVADLHNNLTLLQNIFEKTLTPKAIDNIRHEAAFHPTAEEFKTSHIEAERVKEMIAHKEKALAPLNSLFFELAKTIVKAESFSISVQDDLENVEFHFKEGKPIWMTLPDKKLQLQSTGLAPHKKICRRCGKLVHFVIGTNELCPDYLESQKESPES